jgi:hypothetical protein
MSLLNLLFRTHLTENTPGRRRCWVRPRKPSWNSGPRPADPHTRGGPANAQRSRSHMACALPLAPCTWFAHRARAQYPSECCARWTLCSRAMWTMSRGWWKCQLYVRPHLQEDKRKTSLMVPAGIYVIPGEF